jgi:uncharacterized protein (TIGR02996 family)
MTAAEADRRALLRAVVEAPEDDAVRLVYSDWLEENGAGERDRLHAELIRVQIGLSALNARPALVWRGDPLDDPDLRRYARKTALERRLTELFGSPAAHPALPPGVSYGIRHGFVEKVILDLPTWKEHGPALVSEHPLRRVELRGEELSTGWSEELARANSDARIRWARGEARRRGLL